MASSFVRVEFIKRSEGKNICCKAAYISRGMVEFYGHKFQESKVYNFSNREKPAYNKVLLPSHASEKLRDPTVLWNLCESFEKRKDSQPGLEKVLALPDDRIISLEDKKVLLETFIEKYFISENFGVQAAIHQPHNKSKKDHNWHAHVLITGRRIAQSGDTLESKKPRDFFKKLSNTKWYELWTQHQNEYFEEKGLSLRVDPIGAVPQKHLGPVRMRGQAMSLVIENECRKELNQIECSDPRVILEKIVESKSVFVPKDVDRFLHKNAPLEKISDVRKAFWEQEEIVELLDKETGERTFKYTTKEVVKEEEKILRLADRIQEKNGVGKRKQAEEFVSSLNKEQTVAFKNIVNGKKLSCIDGHAGTGKSYLLASLKDYYENEGFKVRAFGPDNATANVLREKGFTVSQNVYKFLFSHRHGNQKISKGKEVWVLDEAGKLGNKPLLEFLKVAEKSNAQVVFSGSTSQLLPVSRGGFFEVFCDRYGSQTLTDIQRQKSSSHRSMAKSIAKGHVSEAINKLYANGGIHWSKTKEQAMKDLITQWSADIRHFPVSSTLIIARSNNDVRILNEMARSVRKEMGQILEQEFRCETDFGEIFVSQGDRIDFRGNNKEIGVENGMTGTLIKASAKKFVVSINTEEGKSKTVSFDPRYYHSYHLGYASTTPRSQGCTVSRACILYSPGMTKREFYVGITRHKEKVNFFVSQEASKSLCHLKMNICQSKDLLYTTQFTTQSAIERQKEIDVYKSEIQELKGSDHFLDRLKGHGRSFFSSLKKTAGDYYTSKADGLSDRSFYNPDIPKSKKKATIKEVSNDDKIEPQLVKENVPEHKPNDDKQASEVLDQQKALSSENNPAIDAYRHSVQNASMLRVIAVTEADRKGKEVSQVMEFRAWQKACGERNKCAYELKNKLSPKKLSASFKQSQIEVIHDQARRFEDIKESYKSLSYGELEKHLRDNIEPLLYRLFPDGPTRKERNRLRFGSKGSLCVNISGSKEGCFYNFETQEGGGLLKLIGSAQNLSKEEAGQWAKDFLNISDQIKIPKHYQTRFAASSSKDSQWVSFKPSVEAPSLDKIGNGYFSKEYDEQARYPYKDRDGNLLFYTLRLLEKNDSSNKAVLPLSYGHWKNNPKKSLWEFKQYANTDRPIYNQQLLDKNPTTKVLIVEGEKAADAAKRLFDKEKFFGKDLICVTWCGGASAVSKTDWSPLFRRDVLIWPDNDKAGFEAQDKLCSELRRSGVKSLSVLTSDMLKDLPEKWDLADALPQGIREDFVNQTLLRGRDRKLDVNQLILGLGLHREGMDHANLTTERIRLNDILCKVEDRLWSDLEKKHGYSSASISQEVYSKAIRICLEGKKLEKRLQESGLGGELSKSVCYQTMLRFAEKGEMPSEEKIGELKNEVQKFSSLLEKSQKNPGNGYHLDRAIGDAIDNRISEKNSEGFTKDFINKSIDKISAHIDRCVKQELILQKVLEQENVRNRDRGLER